MPPRWLNLYHVTTYERASKILDSNGINPELSEGRVKVSWFVSRRKVGWAIAHILHRHQWPIDMLVVLSVKVESANMLATNRTGVYCSRKTIYPHSMESAEIWLSHEEQYIHIPGTGTNKRRWVGRRKNDAS